MELQKPFVFSTEWDWEEPIQQRFTQNVSPIVNTNVSQPEPVVPVRISILPKHLVHTFFVLV
jgi:hypothetical protein